MTRLYNYLFMLVLFFFASELKAQRYAFDQGSVRLGISLNYANYGGEFYQPNVTARIKSGRITEFAIRPNLAYFFFERLALGAELVYATVGQNDRDNIVSLFSETTWGVGGNISYFFGERQSPIFPFISASYSYQSLSEQDFVRNLDSRSTGTSLRASGGMAIMFGKQASLNVEAFYRVDNRRVQGAEQSRSGNVFGLEVGASLYLF